jgi:hypothetical protein
VGNPAFATEMVHEMNSDKVRYWLVEPYQTNARVQARGKDFGIEAE